jgi:diguanylate cyclase (GGDEF)-like protein
MLNSDFTMRGLVGRPAHRGRSWHREVLRFCIGGARPGAGYTRAGGGILQIHIPTLLLALLMGFLLLTLQLAAAQRRGLRQPALRSWALACWAMLLGLICLGARGLIPLGLSVLLGNGLIALALMLYNQALYGHVQGRPLPRWLWGGPGLFVAWLALTLLRPWPPAERVAGASFVLAGLMLPGVWLVLRHGWHSENSLRAVGLAMALAAAALLVRGVHALQQPADYQELLQASLGQGLTFLVSFVSLLGAGFGFVLASFERVARRMEELATLDGLTGCLNRSTTDTLLAHSLERGRRDGAPLAFALLDLDHFKQINDRHGHGAGDAALRAFAAEVRTRLRSSDVLGRMGGEEFGIVLPGTDAAGAARLIDDVRRAVADLCLDDAEGGRFCLTVSAGIAVAASDSGLTASRLYALADAALYRAKDSGRNCVRVSEGGPLPAWEWTAGR